MALHWSPKKLSSSSITVKYTRRKMRTWALGVLMRTCAIMYGPYVQPGTLARTYSMKESEQPYLIWIEWLLIGILWKCIDPQFSLIRSLYEVARPPAELPEGMFLRSEWPSRLKAVLFFDITFPLALELRRNSHSHD
jgi:hypothetical protein